MYTIQAKKIKINGEWYDSLLEGRFATLFHEKKVPFTPHVRYTRLTHPQCKSGFFNYTIDFLFESPMDFIGMPFIIQALEVKGRMCARDLRRLEALSFYYGITSWFAGEMILDMWVREGMFSTVLRGQRKKPDNVGYYQSQYGDWRGEHEKRRGK